MPTPYARKTNTEPNREPSSSIRRDGRALLVGRRKTHTHSRTHTRAHARTHVHTHKALRRRRSPLPRRHYSRHFQRYYHISRGPVLLRTHAGATPPWTRVDDVFHAAAAERTTTWFSGSAQRVSDNVALRLDKTEKKNPYPLFRIRATRPNCDTFTRYLWTNIKALHEQPVLTCDSLST